MAKKMPEATKKQERRKGSTWRKVHCTDHIEIAYTLLPRLRGGW